MYRDSSNGGQYIRMYRTQVISKAAMAQRMSNFVFVAYSNALGAGILILVVAHVFLQRARANRPPMTLSLLRKYFFLGLTGLTLVQNFTYAGILYSSPTLSSAISNLDTAAIFSLAVIFRMEKVDSRCFRSQMKILGTVVSIAGALSMNLYRGPALWASIPSNASLIQLLQPSASNWVLGGVCFAIAALCAGIKFSIISINCYGRVALVMGIWGSSMLRGISSCRKRLKMLGS